MAVAADARLVAQSAGECLTQRNSHVLDRVVIVDVQTGEVLAMAIPEVATLCNLATSASNYAQLTGSRAEQLLLGLGFSKENLAQAVSTFSGGWRMRLNLAQALKTPQFITLALAHFACCAAHSGPIFHMVSYAMICGIAPLTAVTVYSLAGFSGLGGRLLLGLLLGAAGAVAVELVAHLHLGGEGLLVVGEDVVLEIDAGQVALHAARR